MENRSDELWALLALIDARLARITVEISAIRDDAVGVYNPYDIDGLHERAMHVWSKLATIDPGDSP